jgi:predicted glycogen debranching enzyme
MTLLRRLDRAAERYDREQLLGREWLVTNGLGGYASGSIAGVATRRYHGLLVAALPAPQGRVIMLNHLGEEAEVAGRRLHLSAIEHEEGLTEFHAEETLAEFTIEDGLPAWRYTLGGVSLEKRLLMPHLQNTTHVTYRVRSGDQPVRLRLRPAVHIRSHDQAPDTALPGPCVLTAVENRYELSIENAPVLRLAVHGVPAPFTVDGRLIERVLYRVELARGYPALGSLWSPGFFDVELEPSRSCTLVLSSEPWEAVLALSPEEAVVGERQRRARLIAQAAEQVRSGVGRELVFAADQFVIAPAGRFEDAVRAQSAGDEVRSVVAGYHWFTDWGRDTMIALEGLTLVTGRLAEAGNILRMFGRHMRAGLIPNLFPEGRREGLYHTADATLWFFHAVSRYLDVTDDRETLRILMPALESSVDAHLQGTRFGIGVDPSDGLLAQGAEGFQLTWMDAKVDDWVVTPRRGKAVEINALWYNALCLMEGWLREEGDADAAARAARHAARARESFNRRFWHEAGGYLFDVVDGEYGDDSCFRPNQLLAIALPHPVLEPSRWPSVLDLVERRLVTPVGLRSLAPGERDYKPQYYGDLRARDAAYHQGTVWAWLIGPFVDAWLRVHPGDRAGARRFLAGFADALGAACIGTLAEIFDAEAPFAPRGCVAQAWSIAEVLRGLALTAPADPAGR